MDAEFRNPLRYYYFVQILDKVFLGLVLAIADHPIHKPSTAGKLLPGAQCCWLANIALSC